MKLFETDFILSDVADLILGHCADFSPILVLRDITLNSLGSTIFSFS